MTSEKMFRRKFLKKKSSSGCQDLHYSCAVRLLDDSDVITVSFEVNDNEVSIHTASRVSRQGSG